MHRQNFTYIQIRPNVRHYSRCFFCPKTTQMKKSELFTMLGNECLQYMCERCDFVNCKRLIRLINGMAIRKKVIDKHIPINDLSNIIIDYLAEDFVPKKFNSEGIINV